jgi:hypothetical protein
MMSPCRIGLRGDACIWVMQGNGLVSLCWTGLVKCCLEQEEAELWFDQDVARRGDPEASVVCCLGVDVMESRPAALRD